jgi:hypothetical protein
VAKPAYTETLRRAAIAIGGAKNLARALRAPETRVQRWLDGEERPSLKVYQKALDLLIATGAH